MTNMTRAASYHPVPTTPTQLNSLCKIAEEWVDKCRQGYLVPFPKKYLKKLLQCFL